MIVQQSYNYMQLTFVKYTAYYYCLFSAFANLQVTIHGSVRPSVRPPQVLLVCEKTVNEVRLESITTCSPPNDCRS